MSNLKSLKSFNVATHISSVIGSATSYLIYFLKKQFPEDFFKDTFVAGSLSSLNQKDESNDIYKLRKPTLIVKPVYTGENGIMGELPYWHNNYVYTLKPLRERNQYNRVLYDKENFIFLHSIPNRIKINFEIKIVLPTQMFGYNMLHSIKNLFESNGYFYIDDVKLESEVPKVFINCIANSLDLNLKNFEDQEKFESYLLEHSYNGIEQKRNLSTGNNEYSYKYPVNILVNSTDEPQIDLEKKDFSEEKSTVSFSFSFEFWTNSNFILEMKDIDNTTIPTGEDSDGTYKFELSIPFNWVKNEIGKYHLLYNRKFSCSMNEKIDKLNFKKLISKEIVDVLEYLKKDKKNDPDDVCFINIACNGKLLEKGVDYKVDWDSYDVLMLQPMANTTFSLLFYGDLEVLNKTNNTLINEDITKIKRKEDVK